MAEIKPNEDAKKVEDKKKLQQIEKDFQEKLKEIVKKFDK